MKEEFNLSEKRTYAFNGNLENDTKYCYVEEDVKEFIKRLKKEIKKANWDEKNGCSIFGTTTMNRFYETIDKLAGENLL